MDSNSGRPGLLQFPSWSQGIGDIYIWKVRYTSNPKISQRSRSYLAKISACESEIIWACRQMGNQMRGPVIIVASTGIVNGQTTNTRYWHIALVLQAGLVTQDEWPCSHPNKCRRTDEKHTVTKSCVCEAIIPHQTYFAFHRKPSLQSHTFSIVRCSTPPQRLLCSSLGGLAWAMTH